MDPCELCGSELLEPVYMPAKSGQTVFWCSTCGLCQSLPRIRQSERKVAISGDADWGNIRIGKGLRVPKHLEWLMPSFGAQTVLDVGTNRGAFVRGLLEKRPGVAVDGIEPDHRLGPALEGVPIRHLWWERAENLELPPDRYDFIYCSHTLEHVSSPSRVLSLLRDWVSPSGRLFLEVPDLAFIQRADVYEEFFIDKHLFHFSQSSLAQLFGQTGWSVDLWFADPLQENLSVLLKKGVVQPFTPQAEPKGDLFQRYAERLSQNRAELRARVENLPAHQRCVCFGGGRLFDIARRYGGFQPVAVIDTHLSKHLKDLDGIPVFPPQQLADLSPDLVVLASRGFIHEMEQTVQSLLPNVPIYPLFSGVSRA